VPSRLGEGVLRCSSEAEATWEDSSARSWWVRGSRLRGRARDLVSELVGVAIGSVWRAGSSTRTRWFRASGVVPDGARRTRSGRSPVPRELDGVEGLARVTARGGWEVVARAWRGEASSRAAQLGPEADADLAALDPRSLGLVR
jgi:hypothetical protein